MPKTILLADDSVTIQKVVGISFANEDVVLLTVDNGDDAVARAKEARPDLVLADVMMPGLDGYDVCETLKADPELRHIPVLLLSGTFEPYDEERAARVGADGHITKPFEAQGLVDQVNALLARTATPAADADATVMVADAADGDPDGAFDFFDEEMGRTAPSPPSSYPALLDDEDDGALELEAAIDDDDEGSDLPADSQPLGAASPGDSQATALFLEPTPAGAVRGLFDAGYASDDEDDSLLAMAGPGSSAIHPSDAPHGYEESFEFGFDGGVSEAELSPPATDLATTDPLPDQAALPPIPEPSAPSFPNLLPPPVPAAAVASDAPVAVPVDGAARPSGLSEPIQKHLQETLEKIVWEAFGDVTERIVRDVIERVEAVAWEVIPQMTEMLIREEIRKLQQDSEES